MNMLQQLASQTPIWVWLLLAFWSPVASPP